MEASSCKDVQHPTSGISSSCSILDLPRKCFEQQKKNQVYGNVTAEERSEQIPSRRELARSKCRRKLPEQALIDFDSDDFDALAEQLSSDSSDFDTCI